MRLPPIITPIIRNTDTTRYHASQGVSASQLDKCVVCKTACNFLKGTPRRICIFACDRVACRL